jgi:hypothetical protein
MRNKYLNESPKVLQEQPPDRAAAELKSFSEAVGKMKIGACLNMEFSFLFSLHLICFQRLNTNVWLLCHGFLSPT